MLLKVLLVFIFFYIVNYVILQKKYKINYNDCREHVDFPIDAVYTWVDSSDKEWQKRRDMLQNNYDREVNKLRFNNDSYETRDVELCKSIELAKRNMPWLRNIYVIVGGNQRPSCMKGVKIINHNEIADNEMFNSNTIEMYLHNIPGLSEHFINFNDDFYVLKPLLPTHFFTVDGKAIFRGRFANPDMYHLINVLPKAFLQTDSRMYAIAFYNTESLAGFTFNMVTHQPRGLTKTMFKNAYKRYPNLFDYQKKILFRSEKDLLPLALILNLGLRDGTAIRLKKDPIIHYYSKNTINFFNKIKNAHTICLNKVNDYDIIQKL